MLDLGYKWKELFYIWDIGLFFIEYIFYILLVIIYSSICLLLSVWNFLIFLFCIYFLEFV